ncbi:type II toxin-antitoxin system VapC family toxin [Photorhabdus cinerea]|uniref:PIN domain nuclease n=1 Tax=Photorhabdus cinerea TaxID=471575 RepID=A0A7X5QB80_9GAMM|nr:type II toxin-antitoxin system VapC family toxin [Photorhabdus cinerea]NHB91140.1 PIN domain nuclease [Photorhabdus cinerea]
MNYLLDTHVLIWLSLTPERINNKSTDIITSFDNEVFFSAASIWEVAIKFSIGKINLRPDILRKGLLDNGFKELHVKSGHAVNIPSLPEMHKDPFDRILISQAKVEKMTLITADEKILKYMTNKYIKVEACN